MSGIQKFSTLKPNNLVGKIITMIIDRLPFFTDSDEFKEVLAKKKNENQHSTAFCLYMTNYCRADFYFNREESQKGSSTIDIGVYKGSSLIFVIEAKLLPTPKGRKNKPRNEYEYVYGNGAAIQRFKDMRHGVDTQDKLFSESGILAFVKENDYIFWYEKINQWISDTQWNNSEKLQVIAMNETAILVSEHHRDNNLPIKLHHFWVYVT